MIIMIMIYSILLKLRSIFYEREGGNKWKESINAENRDGTGGDLAREFAKLMKAAWKCQYRELIPRKFKEVLGKYVPHLAGYAQQVRAVPTECHFPRTYLRVFIYALTLHFGVID
jgi:ubiquitin C-terminal hydrolase